MTVKSSISLSDQQDQFARTLVREGHYSSLSAVVQQGLDMLRKKTEAESIEIAALQELITLRRAGAFLSADKMEDRVTTMLARKRRERGLEN